MSNAINLEIITPEETVVKAEIIDLYLPAYYGEAGILENHLPYISLLKFGEISYKDIEKKEHYLYIENGILEVNGNEISIVSDMVIKGEDIESGEIEKALTEVTKKIEMAPDGDLTPEELKDFLEEKNKLIAKKKIAQKII